MFHFQDTTPGWIDALQRCPDGVLVKAVDRADILRMAKQQKPGCVTLLRHWYDHSQHYDFAPYPVKLDRARNFFNSFLDGTFYQQYAPYVDIIAGYNEVWAESHTAAERADRVEQERAMIEVFKAEHAPRLPAHVRYAMASSAVGNHQPKEMYQLAVSEDVYLQDHPYTHWVNNVRSAGDWQNLSGLWHRKEVEYGIKPRYVFDEGGPFESAVDGWKSPACLGGNVDAYVNAVRTWIRDVQKTAAYKEGRIIGPVAIFTTGSSGGQWATYETRQPELNALADMIKAEWKPGTVTPPPNPLPGLRLGSPFREAFVVSSPFDTPRSYGKHEGVDYVATSMQGNEMIHCGYDGTVDLVAYSATGYGKYVRVKHTRNGGTFWTYYAHLDTQLVTVNQVVTKGQVLGEIGSTGNSTGEHLHLTLRVPGYGLSGYVVPDVVNPDPYVDRWQPEPPPPPPTGQGMKNGSFEKPWTNMPPVGGHGLINQQPADFTLTIAEPGQPAWNIYNQKLNTPLVPSGWPECIHKLATQLPPTQQPGGPDALILDGVKVYKVFSAGDQFAAELKQVFTNTTPTRYQLPVRVHYHAPVNTDSPDTAQVHILVNGQRVKLLNAIPDLPNSQWVYPEIDTPAGVVTLQVRFASIWKMPIDFFTDNWHPVAATIPPRTYSRVCHLLPQDATSAEYNIVTAMAREQRQTVLFSIDDAMIGHANLTSRTVYVWGDVRRHGQFTDRASFEAWVLQYYAPLPTLIYRAF